MGIRKNAKFLTPTEREAFVQACVLMKADIVNPGAGADEYSRWDEYVAVHRFIQNVNTPSNNNVNFGHGGLGAYGFLSWHRYFLYRLEQQLQSYVPGVMLPYWDWTDPAGTLVVEDFLGPNGDPLFNNEVQLGYFAADAPGTGANTTPVPVWWPGTLTGWRLHAAFGIWEGPLRRNIQPPAGLPSAATIRSALNMGTLPAFQNACESGSGTAPAHGLHNSLHGWFGGGGHMGSVVVSPFDPMFYLHHCNVDRLWAMWQMDGHADEFPMAGGDPEHHRTDPMYPWVGALAGYSTNLAFAPIVPPDFSAEPVVTHEDVLDHRALGYSYDVQAVVGIALDRTGSMMGMTPDPMTSPAPDVTKWEAAKLGVSAFLLDCETAYDAAEAYIVAGVKTFRQLAVGQFTPVFAGDPYGLVKAGGSYSSTSFDAAVAPLTPGGGTPLGDALLDAHATLVSPPFGWLPADERRYLALFTDGMQNAGTAINTIGDGSLTNTAVFAMGFGTGADVDYATLQDLVDKGETLGVTQVFQGENAGTIDKFYSQSLAAAIGFTPIADPVTELHAGEHEHLQFTATSAEDVFFVTAQGMDFQDDTWSFQLIGPDGDVAYTAGSLPPHSHGGHSGGHGGPRPLVTARRRKGRLSLFLKRNNADASSWVGTWYLLVAWRARMADAMVMLDAGELMVPVSAGPIRGPRYSRLLLKPERRIPARAVRAPARHRLDVRPTSTNLTSERACSVVVNVYARTRLNSDLRVERHGDELSFTVGTKLLRGAIGRTRAFARMIAPTRDLGSLVKARPQSRIPRAMQLDGSDGIKVDSAQVLARLEAQDARLAALRDEELRVVSHDGGALHAHAKKITIPGVYHAGVWIEGVYDPGAAAVKHPHRHRSEGAHGPKAGNPERFERLLTVAFGLARKKDDRRRPNGVRPAAARRGGGAPRSKK